MVYHLNLTVAHLDDGYIKGATPEIIDHPEHFIALALESISQGRSHRLLDQRAERQSCQLCCLVSRRALGQFKGCGHADGGGHDLFASALLYISTQRFQDFCGEFLRLHLKTTAGEVIYLRCPHLEFELAVSILAIML